MPTTPHSSRPVVATTKSNLRHAGARTPRADGGRRRGVFQQGKRRDPWYRDAHCSWQARHRTPSAYRGATRCGARTRRTRRDLAHRRGRRVGRRQLAYRSAPASSTARSSPNSRGHDDRQTRDTARTTALRETMRIDRTRIRPHQTQPRHQTLLPTRARRRRQRMEAHRGNPQPPQALAARQTGPGVNRPRQHP
jgi:hypothetical protein